MLPERFFVEVGDHVMVKLPYSEVMMYMRVAGKWFDVEVRKDSAQLWKNGREFSIPVTLGEAGIYRTFTGEYYIF